MINPHENISVAGFNGVGKTTFIKLLLGLYKPTEGEILIDGRNISEYSAQSFRKFMSAVFQDYKIFAMSVEDNIALESEVDGQSLKESIKRSGIGDKIESLEKKEKSVIGGFFDKGDMLLSGGESQKLAMARSFYRNTDLIALDPIAEKKLYDELYNMMENKTMIMSKTAAWQQLGLQVRFYEWRV